MYVYKVWYEQEFEHPDDIELVNVGSLVPFVKNMIIDDRITDDTLDAFYKDFGGMPDIEPDAIQLLEMNGYRVEKVKVYE